MIALNFYKIIHFSFGWLQFRISIVVKLKKGCSVLFGVRQGVKPLSKINAQQSLFYFSFLRHSERPNSELDCIRQAVLYPFVCEIEKSLSTLSLKMGKDRAENG